MNVCEKPIIETAELITQISDELCPCLCQSNLGVIIIDSERDFSAGSSDALELFASNPQLFESICCRIDDGDDPIIADTDTGSLVGAAIYTGSTFLGYIFIVFASSNRQSVLVQFDLIEVIIRQAELIADLTSQKFQAQNDSFSPRDIFSNATLLSVN